MDHDDHQDGSRAPLTLRAGDAGAKQLAELVEQLCGAGCFVETARSFAVGERIRLVLTARGGAEAPCDLVAEVLRQLDGADGSRRGVEVRIPPDREQDRARLRQLARDGSSPAHRVCRVLVVEDNSLVRRLYAQAFEAIAASARPVEVLTEFVGDGAQAYARLTHRPMIDLVLADLFMPVMDGFELLRRIRAEAGLESTPVVVLTAGGSEAVERAHQLGAQLVLQKPVRTAAITEAVRKLLELPGG
ncbi:MAG TPA: response regulator [Anaeromyxobacteraceae bacterium]|nr:response regulator [Anaeromyxobacteraceae bacterium]